VEGPELENYVGDLEVAVDRLRSLYEQYFMGIEKLEPTVPRKDVDRRIHTLRKTQIRNTALRFRFQMILQRYNTYQTHWQRICRQIENGTYKRHMLRAEARFAPAASPPSPPAAAASAAVAPKVDALPPAPALAQPGVVAAHLADELAALDADFGPLGASIADDDLDMDDPVEAALRPAKKPGPTWKKAAPAAPRASQPPPVPAAGPRPPGLAPRGAPPPVGGPRPPPVPPPARPGPPRAPSAGAPRPGPPPAPAARPAPPSPAAARPAPPPAPAAARPAPPPPAAAPAPPRPAPAPPAPPKPAQADMPEDRVRQIYAQYVQTKRQLNESTATITYEGVARTLRESSAKLREKHGKNVDFEVSVKDGKTILKPVIK
jgi:hypothetical protein